MASFASRSWGDARSGQYAYHAESLERYALQMAQDPVFFMREALGREFWLHPRMVFRNVAQPRSKTTWQACHGVGKSEGAAGLTIWFTSSGGVTILTAPTLRQVKNVVFNKIRAAHKSAAFPLGSAPLRSEWQLSPDVFALGVTADSASAFQGFHGRRVLVIVDEAMGVNEEMWGAMHGIESGGDVRFLELANPTDASGAFYEHCRDPLYTNFKTSAFDTPNLTSLRDELGIAPDAEWTEMADAMEAMPRDDPRLHVDLVDYLPGRAWVWERLQSWGRDHPMFESRVLGEFPSQSDWALVSLRWLDSAAKRSLDVPDSAIWQCGIDVGAGGEGATVANLRHGAMLVVPPFATNEKEPQGEVIRWLRAQEATFLGKRESKRSRIIVTWDNVGPGSYFAQPLIEAGFRCAGVNVGLPSRNREQFRNLKAELCWGLRERFREGDIGGVRDKLTRSQTASIQYSINARGQIEIQSKKDAGGKSPDHFESLMLTYTDVRALGARRPLLISV